ncbi:translation elongation factor Ts [Coriobacteriia bacterium Es71-Z0120]|uniref:translation elongation factor Ts n=1 Tax=Parvivirga hydrogeniphila TaxID=2939460 RepID=UPI002260E1DB|nr:translation elongation factor Ts [Parvivirga hydrogeniphila]MCL4079586.1 translation elongation factor Ts [Parvivirga hydrogeniphila]
MEITARMVQELREMTGAGMMDCKKALTEADGDVEKAVDILRTRGLAALQKKAGRATNEGVVAAHVSEDKRIGALVEVNCETDFVARNADFLAFVNDLAAHIAAAAPADVAALASQTFTGREHSVQEVLGETVSKLGENMNITRFVRREVSGTGAIASYIHMGGKIGVLVEAAFTKPETASADALASLLKDVAMQVAAASPIAVSREDVPAETVEHELAIYRAQAAESGKPEQIQQKIAEGRLHKFYKEVCLLEQAFVKDPEISVGDLVARVSKELGDTVSIVGVERFQLGETSDAEPAAC